MNVLDISKDATAILHYFTDTGLKFQLSMVIEMQFSPFLLLMIASFHDLHDGDCAVIQSHVTINDPKRPLQLLLNA